MWPLSSRLRPSPEPPKRASELRAPGEAEPRRHLATPAVERARLGLEQLDLGARRLEPRRQMLLQRGLLARRLAGLAAGRGLEPDQLAGELDELVGAIGDRGDDPVLVAHAITSIASAVRRLSSRIEVSSRAL